MKKLKGMLVMVLTAGLVFTAVAQPQQKKEKLDEIALKYNFTAEQKIKFKEAAKVKRGEMKALKAKTDLDKSQKRAEMKQIRSSFDSSIKTFLSNDQYTKMKADAEAKRVERRKNKQAENLDKRADAMKTKYNLSDEQHTKVKTAMSEFSSDRKGAAAKGEKGSVARKTAMKAAKKDFDSKMKSALTDAKYTQWKADMKAKRKENKAKMK